MEICRSLKDINRLKNAVVTIGTFDGLHRGHQEVIRHVVSTASAKQSTSVVVTFDPHPRHILDKDFVLPLLINLEDEISPEKVKQFIDSVQRPPEPTSVTIEPVDINDYDLLLEAPECLCV